MPSYIYKVTKETVKLKNGEIANKAVYAYKPSRTHEKLNIRDHFRTGCGAHDRAAAAGKRSCWVVEGEGDDAAVLKFPHPVGTYDDDWAADKYCVGRYVDFKIGPPNVDVTRSYVKA